METKLDWKQKRDEKHNKNNTHLMLVYRLLQTHIPITNYAQSQESIDKEKMKLWKNAMEIARNTAVTCIEKREKRKNR